MSLYSDYNNIFVSLFRLNTFDTDAINNFYNDIKNKIIEPKLLDPKQVIILIEKAFMHNIKYYPSYLALIKKINKEYLIKENENLLLILINSILFNFNNNKTYLDHIFDPNNSIHAAIINDDIKSFISYTNNKDFNINQKLQIVIISSNAYNQYSYLYNSFAYPLNTFSILELCCYCGSVKCFKFLRTEFKTEITDTCLQFSFIGGNPYIMKECLKEQMPNDLCMKYAIISHNIDFVIFLMNTYNININFECCCEYNFLQGLLIYLDQTRNFQNCFPAVAINFTFLYDILISHGANINAKDSYDKDALYYSLTNKYNDTAKLLILKGAEVKRNTDGYNDYCHFQIAVEKNNYDIMDFLIKHGANINIRYQDGKSFLHYAVKLNNKETMKFLIDNGLDVNILDKDNNTALLIAYKDKMMDNIEFLIEHGANINLGGSAPIYQALCKNDIKMVEFLLSKYIHTKDKCTYGKSPLHFAVECNYNEISKMLISKGYLVSEQDYFKKTVLHYSVEKNNMEITKLCISKGVNINEMDCYQQTALHFATKNNNKEMVKFLIMNGADCNAKNDSDETPLNNAIYCGNNEIIKLLIMYGADCNACKECLHCAVQRNKIEIVSILLHHIKDINSLDYCGQTALSIASEKNYKEIAELLVVNGADVNMTKSVKNSPIYCAVTKNYTNIAKLLISHGANCNLKYNGLSIIHYSVKNNNKEILEMLIHHGVDINTKDDEGRTSLHLASTNNYAEIVKFLVLNGADLNSKDKFNITLFQYALRNYNVNIMKTLILYGIDANTSVENGLTALHFALWMHDKEMIVFLISHGININCRIEKDGRSAIHLASIISHENPKYNEHCVYEEILELLINHGADINAIDIEGRTALHYASEQNEIEEVSILVSHGANINAID